MTTDPFLDQFERHLRVERGLAEKTTLKTYGYQIRTYQGFLQTRSREATTATRDDVLAFLEQKRTAGQRSATLFGAAIAVRHFHRFLAAAGIAAADPTIGMKLPTINSQRREPLTEEETTRLFSFPTVKFHDIRDRAVLELLYSGLRISEALAIRLEDIHAEEGYVQVTFGKGGRQRVAPVGTKATEALKWYIEARTQRFGANLPDFFVSYRGRRLTRTAFWQRLKLLGRRAGIQKHIFPHLLRHGFATVMLNHGCDLKSLQEMLGHNRLSTTTSIYLHPTAAQLVQAHRRAHPRA